VRRRQFVFIADAKTYRKVMKVEKKEIKNKRHDVKGKADFYNVRKVRARILFR